MFLPGISQHKCRHHTITQGTEGPKVSAHTAWLSIRVSHVYLEMPGQTYGVRAGCRQGAKPLLSMGLHLTCKKALGKKMQLVLTLLAHV